MYTSYNKINFVLANIFQELPLMFFSVDGRCPTKLKHYFTEPSKESFTTTVYANRQKKKEAEIAVTYINERYTLGTFYRSNFWNQKRTHLSYFQVGGKPVYCGLKCLHDGYDYASGMIVTAQDGTAAVSMIGFITDGGDTHMDLDKVRNATINASDFRIRFEFGGNAAAIDIRKVAPQSFEILTEEDKVMIHFPYASFGDSLIQYVISEETAHTNETGDHRKSGYIKCVDAILYHGVAKNINFAELSQCCIGIAFEVRDKTSTEVNAVTVNIKGGKLTINYKNLMVQGPVSACTKSEFNRNATAYRDGTEYLSMYNENN